MNESSEVSSSTFTGTNIGVPFQPTSVCSTAMLSILPKIGFLLAFELCSHVAHFSNLRACSWGSHETLRFAADQGLLRPRERGPCTALHSARCPLVHRVQSLAKPFTAGVWATRRARSPAPANQTQTDGLERIDNHWKFAAPIANSRQRRIFHFTGNGWLDVRRTATSFLFASAVCRTESVLEPYCLRSRHSA